MNKPRCPLQCPHGDRCTLDDRHDGGCNHRACSCNEASVQVLDADVLAARMADIPDEMWDEMRDRNDEPTARRAIADRLLGK